MKKIGYLLLIIFVFLSSILFFSIWRKIGERKGIGEEGIDADITVNRVNLKEMDGKRVLWQLTAGEGKYYRKGGFVILKDVKVIFHSKQGKTYTLKGREGRYYEKTGDVKLSGGVVGLSDDGYRILTESLLYRSNEGLIETDKKVTIEGPDMVGEGIGLWVDVNKSLFSLKRSVRTSISPGGLNEKDL